MCKAVIRVWKGIRQGGVTSPPLYNNSVVAPQKKARISFVFKGLDLSILNYADDILNLSRTVSSVEENFSVLSREYAEIGLNFNASKSEVLTFGKSVGDVGCVQLGNQSVQLSACIKYLGLPIGDSVKTTRALLISHLSEKLRKAFGVLVCCKACYSRRILARVYNAFAMPHVLALTPFWNMFTATDKKTIRSVYFRFAKFLLCIPLWARNKRLVSAYGLTEPLTVAEQRRGRYFSRLDRTNSLHPAMC